MTQRRSQPHLRESKETEGEQIKLAERQGEAFAQALDYMAKKRKAVASRQPAITWPRMRSK